MPCPICGQYIIQQAISAEAALLLHRVLKHQPPAIQVLTTLALSVLGTWGACKLVGKLR